MTVTYIVCHQPKNDNFSAIYHIGYAREARAVTENLVTLCKEYFGAPSGVCFTSEVCDVAGHQTFKQVTSTIEDNGNLGNNDMNLLKAFGYEMTDAARRRTVANGKVLPDSNAYDGSISSDDDKGEQENTVFLLPQIFNYNLAQKEPLGLIITIPW